MHRASQCIFLLRDSFSSYTITTLIPDEQKSTIKAMLIDTIAELKAPRGCTVRVDGAPSFLSLVDATELQANKIHLELG